MNPKREVELNLPEEFLDALSAGGVGPVDRRITDAVGYLSMWGMGGKFVKVRIVGDRRGELTAQYIDANGDYGFIIGAVPDEGWNYSFHS